MKLHDRLQTNFLFTIVISLSFSLKPIFASDQIVGVEADGETKNITLNATSRQEGSLFKAIREDNVDAITSLIQLEKVEVNRSWSEGRTALMEAASYGRHEIVKYFIDQGAVLNDVDQNGWTALMYAANNGHYEVVKYLVALGADIYKESKNGSTALMLAASSGYYQIAKYLITQGSAVTKVDNVGRTALIYAAAGGSKDLIRDLIATNKIDVNQADHHGTTALMLAAYYGYYEVVRCLLGHGADVDKVNRDGLTALKYAVRGCGPFSSLPFKINPKLRVNKIDHSAYNHPRVPSGGEYYKIVKRLLEREQILKRQDGTF
jgi:ankyrin repeat protein